MAIKLLFSGDFAPLIDSAMIAKNHFSDLDDVFLGADCHITNLECPLTLVGKAIEKTGPALKAHPDTIELLQQARVDVACLANNHSFDFGDAGLRETIDACERNKIATLGIVNRGDGNGAWLIKEIRGKKIGFMNYCEHEFSVREEGEFGANGYDPIRCFYEVPAMRRQVDHLIVIYHGGNEYYPLPRPGLKKTFHYLADLGADAVIGHHSHVISGYELYKGKPLVYSLGNFFFPFENEPPEWYTGMLCTIHLAETMEIELFPCGQGQADLNVHRLSEQENIAAIEQLKRLSAIIRDHSSLQENWRAFILKNSTGCLKKVPGIGTAGRALLKLGLPLKKVVPEHKRLASMNLLRNQSHEELLLAVLKESIQ